MTARGYADMVRPFLAGREEASGLAVPDLTAAEVTAFVLAACPGKPKGTAKLTVTALRSLLGFLPAEGLISGPFGQHLPAVASWRLAGLRSGLCGERPCCPITMAWLGGSRAYALFAACYPARIDPWQGRP